MKLRFATLLLLALSACSFRVDVGSTAPFGGGTGSAFTGGGGGTLGSTCGTSTLRAFSVELDALDGIPESCWRDGQFREDAGFSSETFEVLIISMEQPANFFSSFALSDSTLAISGMSPHRLGEMGVVTLGEAITGRDAGFDWEELEITRTDAGTTTQRVGARFEFDRTDTTMTRGLLKLWSSETGVPNKICQLTRRFTATALDTIPRRWTTLTTPELSEARRLLVSLETGQLRATEQQRCWGGRPPPAFERQTPFLRTLEVWQVNQSSIRVPPRVYELGDAPRIELPSDLAPPFSVTTESSATPIPEAFETRITRISFAPRACGVVSVFSAPHSLPELELQSEWTCVGAECPYSPSVDRGTCQTGVTFFTAELP